MVIAFSLKEDHGRPLKAFSWDMVKTAKWATRFEYPNSRRLYAAGMLFYEARLLQNNCASKDRHKRVRFLHEQPLVRPSYDHLDAPQRTENIDHPVVLEPKDVGQQDEEYAAK